jgi:hypothetical protein
MGRGERLRQVIPGTGPERFDARRDARVARHHDDDRFLVSRQRRTEDLHSRNRGHIEVDQHDVELAPPNQLERLVTTTERRDVEAIHLQHAGAPFAEGAVVVYDEKAEGCLDLGGNGERIPRGFPIRCGKRTTRIT